MLNYSRYIAVELVDGLDVFLAPDVRMPCGASA
jgi:hypothetical protein